MSESVISAFEEAGQGHVFAYLGELSEGEAASLLAQAGEIDLGELAGLAAGLKGGEDLDLEGLSPAPFTPLPGNGGDAGQWARARELGDEALRAGRVAAFTVAGGQGTRLGFAGPKGTFPVSPVRGASLFQIFAEKILAASRRYGKAVPWFIMTSGINHEETVSFFAGHDYFGLPEGDVHFFRQGLMPAVTPEGKIILSGKGEIAMSPDGHGGSLRALVRSGATAEMARRGIDIISYFQVDNPLVRVIDPAFVGFHLLEGSELSSKALPKAYAEEKVGVFCQRGGKSMVVEYSDLPDELMRATGEDGGLLFRAGSIAIHLFSRGFVDRVGGGGGRLPFHRALKKVPALGADGLPATPDEPNGVKFEMFVFDALPLAANPVIIETAREDDFSPVKNAEGLDSPLTCADDQRRQFARWMRAAGVELATDASGLPEIALEVSPLFADSEEAFVAAWGALGEKPEIAEGLLLV